MTEQEWLVSTDPAAMLSWAQGEDLRGHRLYPISDRKLRLFACACCRQIWEWMDPLYSRDVIDVSEKHADGLVDEWHLASYTGDCGNIGRCLHPGDAIHNATAVISTAQRHNNAILPVYAGILRHVVGNPWRPVKLWEPLRRDSIVGEELISLAQSLYDGEDVAAILYSELMEVLPATVVCPECSGMGIKDYGSKIHKTDCGCGNTGRIIHPLLEHFRPRVECGWCDGRGGHIPVGGKSRHLAYRKEGWVHPTAWEKCPACKGCGYIGHVTHPKGCHVLDAILGKD